MRPGVWRDAPGGSLNTPKTFSQNSKDFSPKLLRVFPKNLNTLGWPPFCLKLINFCVTFESFGNKRQPAG